jgi:hypothetical protein
MKLDSLETVRPLVVTAALALVASSAACIADRPSRNGVFDENQYIRKDFLVRPGSGGSDPGWFMKATVTATSTPNPLGGPSGAGLYVGAESGGSYVRFEVTQDKLNMLSMRELSAGVFPVPGDPAGATASAGDQGSRLPEVVDAWPVTNVDLKYRVNLNGEKSNFYEENQELDWQLRQWVKINFAKNDMADFEPFGPYVRAFLAQCTDSGSYSATLETGSFLVDEPNDYWQFTLRITAPINYVTLQPNTPPTIGPRTTGPAAAPSFSCADAMGSTLKEFVDLGRQNVAFDVKYSFMRAKPAEAITYRPLVIEEHDPIRRKYGTIDIFTPTTDPNTGLESTRQLSLRFDPQADFITYYFARGYPDAYKSFFKDPGGLVDQTNAILAKANAKVRLRVKDYDDPDGLAPGQTAREMGDVRYSFIRWISDFDAGAFPVLGATQFVPDPRTGEILSDSINIYDFAWKDYVLARLDFYEQSIGAVDWSPNPPNGMGSSSCTEGDTVPLVPAVLASNHNASSTLFQKIQQYMQQPAATYGNLGPTNFIVQQSPDFFRALRAILPYEVYGDPAANQFVTWSSGQGAYGASAQLQSMANEAQFHQIMGAIDRGWAPYDVGDPNAMELSLGFSDALRTAVENHRENTIATYFRFPNRFQDDINIYSLPNLFQRDARHCIGGAWETRDQYVANLIKSYYAQTVWHEFGHALGLPHNFMGSMDRSNFPHYTDAKGDHIGGYSSSLMEYNVTADRVFWANGSGKAGWFPHDQAALGFLYSNPGIAHPTDMNAADPNGKTGSSVSGQSGTAVDGSMVNAQSARWQDPYGYDSQGAEIQFFYCNETHVKYTPFCRPGDFGTTPSEITANEIDAYEWQYLWRNFRQYHKFFEYAQYADTPTTFFTELRRFQPVWAYDWSLGELNTLFRKVNLTPPDGSPTATYFTMLGLQFDKELSASMQLAASTSEAIVQQSSGQRPYVTIYDPYFGDETQQGIAIDKIVAIQGFDSLWQVTDFDQNQAQGAYLWPFSFSGDAFYNALSQQVVTSMIGGGYNLYYWAIPSSVLQFAQATHDPYFVSGSAMPQVRDWIGGYVFLRERDFLDFFRKKAVDNGRFVDETGQLCTSIDRCSYDPRIHQNATQVDPLDTYHSDFLFRFVGPDQKRWIWSYVADRNTWVACDRDRNIGTYQIQFQYNTDIASENDGNGDGVYSDQLPLKYFIDYYNKYNISY